MAQALRARQLENPARNPNTGIMDAVRAFVLGLRSASPSGVAAEPERPDGVLLDVQVDGVRCLLIRAQADSSRAHVWLSPRELEIVRMVAKGYPNKMIAAVLEISCWTVSTYLRRIFAKLGVSSRAAMVARLGEYPQAREIPPRR